ncbi:MAG: hypothetical protein GY710_02675 [Desulfobacteraceae bacterium]|nr:hypothetical protein [Desulfobacteraceae bacterium]
MNEYKNLKTMIILFLSVFMYAVIAMVVCRELVIPRMAPLSINGNIAGDPQIYNQLALNKVKDLRAQGIKAFELRPKNQGPAGIASLNYWFIKNIYGMVFINAFLHALSIITMVMIFRYWFSLRTSILAVLPLAISPNMMIAFSQINKDSFALTGTLLLTYGLLRLIQPTQKTILLKNKLLSLLIAVAGMFLVFIMRPYINQMLLPITALILILRIVYYLMFKKKNREWIHLAIFGSILLIGLGLLSHGADSDATLKSFDSFSFHSSSDSVANKSVNTSVANKGVNTSVANKCFNTIDDQNWQNWDLFPNFINHKLKALMGQRCLIFTIREHTSKPAVLNSFVDMDKFPQGSMEALCYIPRAFLIGIFTPWPNLWFSNWPSVFYTLVPFEAAGVYIGIMGLIIWLIRRKNCLMLVPIGLSFAMMTIFGMANPHIGTLYRYRYPWWMLILCLGIAAWIDLIEDWKRKPIGAC